MFNELGAPERGAPGGLQVALLDAHLDPRFDEQRRAGLLGHPVRVGKLLDLLALAPSLVGHAALAPAGAATVELTILVRGQARNSYLYGFTGNYENPKLETDRKSP